MEPPNAVIMRLPSDSELIRSNIVDSNFDCEEHGPGYYADVDNECQVRTYSFPSFVIKIF